MQVTLSHCAYAIVRPVCLCQERPSSVWFKFLWYAGSRYSSVDIVTRLQAGCVRDPSVQGKSSPNHQDKRRGPPNFILFVYRRFFLQRQSRNHSTSSPTLIIPSIRVVETIYICISHSKGFTDRVPVSFVLEFCTGVLQNSVRNAKFSVFFPPES